MKQWTTRWGERWSSLLTTGQMVGRSLLNSSAQPQAVQKSSCRLNSITFLTITSNVTYSKQTGNYQFIKITSTKMAWTCLGWNCFSPSANPSNKAVAGCRAYALLLAWTSVAADGHHWQLKCHLVRLCKTREQVDNLVAILDWLLRKR